MLLAKPCRFFQVNNCPLAEVECNFLHVKAEVAADQGKKLGKPFARADQNGPRDNYRQGGEGNIFVLIVMSFIIDNNRSCQEMEA